MMNLQKTLAAACAAFALFSTPASAIEVTAGPGGFDQGFATTITYDTEADRGTANGRDNPLNALGAPDSAFFEIGRDSAIDLTFGTLFDTEVSVFEITFGNRDNFIEAADVSVGLGGVFTPLARILNTSGEITSVIASSLGVFDTVRIVDVTSQVPGGANGGGFDIDAVRVQAVPLPAGIILMLTAIGGLGLFRRYASAKTAA